MESVPEFINSIILKIFPSEIAYGIIMMGFIIFFLCFYGPKEWKSFSDLDKIVFSIFTGAFFWYLFIFPLAMGYEILKIIFTYTEDLDVVNKSIHDFNFISGLIVLLFIIARISSNTPLFYNKKFLKLNIDLTKVLIVFYVTLLIFLYKSPFNSSIIIEPIAISSFFLFILNIILLRISKGSSDLLPTERAELLNKFRYYISDFRLNKIVIFFLVVILIAMSIAIYINYQFQHPPIEDKEFTIVRLEIPILWLDKSYNGNLSGSLLINKQFGLKFGLIKWAYISTNFTIKDANREGTFSKIENISGKVVILRGDSKMNVTLIGNQEINVDKNFYALDTVHMNNTEIWNISFNRMNYEIDINEIVIRFPENLRLTNYKNYGLAINRERLDENLNKSIRELIISNVEIPTVRYNDGINITKISLYFMDNNS